MGNNATEMMAESYDFDTAPMERFDPVEVNREFGIPAEDEVVALLAIDRAQEPDKAYPGRFRSRRLFSASATASPGREPP